MSFSPMTIVLLGSGKSIHTVRWANALSQSGHNVSLFTMHIPTQRLHYSVNVRSLPFPPPVGYITNAPIVRHWMQNLRADILHAHYVTGYGRLARAIGFHPTIMSVWGSDVCNISHRSCFLKKMVLKNLYAADHVCATSHSLASDTQQLAPNIHHITVTPFGIDLNKFVPREKSYNDVVTIGTVKTLSPTYGIDTLIDGFSLCRKLIVENNSINIRDLRLRIVGTGPQQRSLERQARNLGVCDVTTFVGAIPHEKVPVELGKLDVYVAVSRRESFGVSVLEASACELPVIVSAVGGLPEVVDEGSTGYIIPKEDPDALSKVLFKLATNNNLRQTLGAAGRHFVAERYEWRDSVSGMENVYKMILEREYENDFM